MSMKQLFAALLLLSSLAWLACGGDDGKKVSDTDAYQSEDLSEDGEEYIDTGLSGEDLGPQDKDIPIKDIQIADTSKRDTHKEDTALKDTHVEPEDTHVSPEDTSAGDASAGDASDGSGQPDTDTSTPESCYFGYETMFVYPLVVYDPDSVDFNNVGQRIPDVDTSIPAPIDHAEPPPESYFIERIQVQAQLPAPPLEVDIVMPGYTDDMPLFERAEDWDGGTRCYETPLGVLMLTESEAYDLYKKIAERTTGGTIITTPGVRTVVGIRGAYPGTFSFNGNKPDRFNDTLVLLWIDASNVKQVLEFAAHTDTGAYVFDMSSSLRPNRVYPYINGWHKGYNALQINISGYAVRDDANHNGHWDSDRNGWLPPFDADDFDRTGSAHNIHCANKYAPLGEAEVSNQSAGCQTVPGIASWTQFITHAWTKLNDPVKYFLVDVRDIDHTVWFPCTPDGSHECPFPIKSFPYDDDRNTSTVATEEYDVYNCSTANESGPEVVYFFTIQESGTISIALNDVAGDNVDMDVHLLDADDPDACLGRDNVSVTWDLTPGRYFIIVDTYVKDGKPLVGAYHMNVTFE